DRRVGPALPRGPAAGAAHAPGAVPAGRHAAADRPHPLATLAPERGTRRAALADRAGRCRGGEAKESRARGGGAGSGGLDRLDAAHVLVHERLVAVSAGLGAPARRGAGAIRLDPLVPHRRAAGRVRQLWRPGHAVSGAATAAPAAAGAPAGGGSDCRARPAVAP